MEMHRHVLAEWETLATMYACSALRPILLSARQTLREQRKTYYLSQSDAQAPCVLRKRDKI